MKKRGQISTEYLIVAGFVTFLIIVVLGISFFYTNNIGDSIRLRQMDSFANKVVSSSESVFYFGAPSKTTITAYLPAGIEGIEVYPEEIAFNISTSSGTARTTYLSKVPLEGEISSYSGTKALILTARDDRVTIEEKS